MFGSRQAGVRIVSVVDSPQALLEDEGVAVPAAAAEQLACNAGRIAVTVDRRGDPLRLGRIERLFTSAQRLALAVRDGGCRWRGCDRPPSYCEAHHIDEWADGGSTDIDRGILLCRFHHMQLHHGEWRITRDGVEDFLLHSPRGEPPAILKPRLALGYTWADLAPPTGVQAAS
ncbi:HNH endonuclease signature motif containing protein [Microbacterium sp. CIAB417]|uniref:HNH endonuclease signature motif containing protein n=1 Tax=Microbacterium sp. CIAB417 TaxID=2860287 RepID=UPI001FABF011|nr:HNH endonuclease signature motif containing protein [Microbacterium sp. CIAB417]